MHTESISQNERLKIRLTNIIIIIINKLIILIDKRKEKSHVGISIV